MQSPSHDHAGDTPDPVPAARRLKTGLPLAPLRLRLVSLVYEGILLCALLFVFSYLFLGIARDAQSGLPRILFQAYLLSVGGAYFVFCWARTGQTLPMKTWRIRVVTAEGGGLSAGTAFKRYLLAVPGILSGLGLFWALFDRQRQFLHDRLAGTRIVRVDAERKKGNGEPQDRGQEQDSSVHRSLFIFFQPSTSSARPRRETPGWGRLR